MLTNSRSTLNTQRSTGVDDAQRSTLDPGAAPPRDKRVMARLRWRCRRGMLENDLVLTRFLETKGRDLTEDDVAMLDRLLDLSDNDLWDLIAGRSEPQEEDVVPILLQLRAA
jgi:antitoxin CptB